jgi:hypothetical protein
MAEPAKKKKKKVTKKSSSSKVMVDNALLKKVLARVKMIPDLSEAVRLLAARLENLERRVLPEEVGPTVEDIMRPHDPQVVLEVLFSVWEDENAPEPRFDFSQDGELIVRTGMDNLVLLREAFMKVYERLGVDGAVNGDDEDDAPDDAEEVVGDVSKPGTKVG